MTEEQPVAMLPKGPVWMSAGTPSPVRRRLGARASRRMAAMAPAAPRSSAVTQPPSRSRPTTILPSRSRRSASDVARERMTMTSLVGVMSKEDWRVTPSTRPPSPVTMWRRARSLTSRTRGQVRERSSMRRALPWWRWLSMRAARRLWAAVTAWKSPVRWRFMRSAGWMRAPPAPPAPPLMPKVGPMADWRRVWARPMATVDFPSPKGVGLIAVTTTQWAPLAGALGSPGVRGSPRAVGAPTVARALSSILATSRP